MSKITTHILDTARGCPAEGVKVILYGPMASSGEEEIAYGYTNKDGRIADWLGADGSAADTGSGVVSHADKSLNKGVYKIRFGTGDYFDKGAVASFYPWVDIYFEVVAEGHYHVPLLISPYGYSTYRGS